MKTGYLGAYASKSPQLSTSKAHIPGHLEHMKPEASEYSIAVHLGRLGNAQEVLRMYSLKTMCIYI